MVSRVAIIGIIIESTEEVEAMNSLLHQYADYIISRTGVPYRQRGINIISVALDAPQDAINTLSGKLGKLPGISTKTLYSNTVFDDE